MAKEYTGSEYIEVVDSTIGIKPEKIIEVEPGPGIGIDYPDGKMKISVNLTDEQRLALKGDKGDTGAPGKDGQNGKDGKDGRDGTNGQDGRNGTDGIQGPPGNDGKDGNNGKSVVLTPISNGVNIKLEGDTGDGYDITNGAPGTPGEPGAPGQGITNIVQQSVTPTFEGGEEQVFTIYVGDASYDVKVLNGMKGDTGAPGQGFKITKTYTSVASMKADAKNIMEGQFVMIASNVEDPDNAQLYVRNSNAFDSSEPFTFIADLSGAQGIKGETGTSVSLTTDSTSPKITFTVPAHTDNTGVAVPEQTTSIQASEVHEAGRGDGVSLTVGDKSVTIYGGADIEVSDVTNGIKIKPSNKETGKDITASKTGAETTLSVGNKNVTINDGVGVTVSEITNGIKFTGGTGEASITAADDHAVSGRGTGVSLTVGSKVLTIQGGQDGAAGQPATVTQAANTITIAGGNGSSTTISASADNDKPTGKGKGVTLTVGSGSGLHIDGGNDGEDGKDAGIEISNPTRSESTVSVTLTPTVGGIPVTSKEKTITLNDGSKGEDGKNGQDASVELASKQTPDGVQVTLTSKTGTEQKSQTSFTILNNRSFVSTATSMLDSGFAFSDISYDDTLLGATVTFNYDGIAYTGVIDNYIDMKETLYAATTKYVPITKKLSSVIYAKVQFVSQAGNRGSFYEDAKFTKSINASDIKSGIYLTNNNVEYVICTLPDKSSTQIPLKILKLPSEITSSSDRWMESVFKCYDSSLGVFTYYASWYGTNCEWYIENDPSYVEVINADVPGTKKNAIYLI